MLHSRWVTKVGRAPPVHSMWDIPILYLPLSGAVSRSSQYKAEPFVPTGGDVTLNLLPLCKFIEPFDGEQTTVRGFATIRVSRTLVTFRDDLTRFLSGPGRLQM